MTHRNRFPLGRYQLDTPSHRN